MKILISAACFYSPNQTIGDFFIRGIGGETNRHTKHTQSINL
jgi:hypothetical protein